MWLATDLGTERRGPFDDFWYQPVGAQTFSGVRVNAETAMRLAVLYACVRVVSEDIGKLPLALYRRKDADHREIVRDHPAARLLRRPNGWQTGQFFIEGRMVHLMLRGNAYARIEYQNATPVRLIPLDPDLVTVETLPNGMPRWVVRSKTGDEKRYVFGEILHLRGISQDGYLGLSPIDQAREAVGEAISAEQYSAAFFGNNAQPGLWLKHPGNFKDEVQRNNWIQSIKRNFTGANRFNPMVLEYGIELKEIPIKHTDVQFLETRKYKANEICALFRVPPHKVGILDRATHSNIEHQGIEYVVDTLLSWVRRLEDGLNHSLLTEDEQDTFYFEFNLSGLMRGDFKSRSEAYTSAIMNGWMTRNEVRRLENLPPLPGLDEPLLPLNMVAAPDDGETGEAGSQTAAAERDEEEAAEQDADNETSEQ